MGAAEPLFDPDDWLEGGAESPFGLAAGASAPDELALDERRILVDDDEGRKSRKVHLNSADKAYYAHYYADIVGTGMRNAYGGPLAWVELFAGPGRLWVVEEERYRPGSPVEALNIAYPFNHYVFCDLSPECVNSLEARVGDEPGVHVLEGDANSAQLHDSIASIVPRNALVILYADPQGLDVELDTIRYFADRYKHLDLLINFPVRGVIRALRAGHQEKASRVLGHHAPLELITKCARSDWGPSVRTWFERQLRGMGYSEFAAQQVLSYGKRTPLYDVVLASRQPRAVEFFREATKRGPAGQYSLDV